MQTAVRHYFSSDPSAPNVYHFNPACPVGTRISPRNRVVTENAPTAKAQCQVCKHPTSNLRQLQNRVQRSQAAAWN
jgi:hypothetical protein